MLLTYILVLIATVISFFVSKRNIQFVNNYNEKKRKQIVPEKESDAVFYSLVNGGLMFLLNIGIPAFTDTEATVTLAVITFVISLAASLMSVVITTRR